MPTDSDPIQPQLAIVIETERGTTVHCGRPIPRFLHWLARLLTRLADRF